MEFDDRQHRRVPREDGPAPRGGRHRAPTEAEPWGPDTADRHLSPDPAPGRRPAQADRGQPSMPAESATVEIPATAVPPAGTQDGSGRRTGAAPPARGHGLGRALLTTAAATVLPGSGHLLLHRRRTGSLIVAAFLLLVGAAVAVALTVGRSRLLALALSTRVLLGITIGCVAVGLLWIAVIVRTYLIARPRPVGTGRRVLGAVSVAMLCVIVAAPLGFAADLAESQRTMVNTLFPTGATTGPGGTAGTDVPLPPRINILLFGSDAGSDRTGTRSDSMMVASVDTITSRAVVFGLPRNIEQAPFPPGSAMAAKFPDGFFDPSAPLSGDYLLNAEYTYGTDHPELAPAGPTTDPGLNLLMSSVGEMLGLPINYYTKIDMAGFAAIIDAVGGVTIDVGPVPLPIGGVLPDGTHVAPSGYVPAGVQHLDGNQALWYARSRRDSDDYSRMSRQRCLIHTVLEQKSATDLLTHFQAVAAATANSVSTNIPQSFLPSLAALAGDVQNLHLDSVAFDPSLPDPHQPDGWFDPSHPDFGYIRQIVASALTGTPLTSNPPQPTSTATPQATPSAGGTTAGTTTAVVPLADSCTSATPHGPAATPP
ncbi:MAG: hypothetical protein JWR81_1880 [Pseudonocardia sp.]|nr:hypothetical protein [Pseudonocardia sp.]